MLEGCTPWPPDFAQRHHDAGLWRDETIGEMLDASAERHGDTVALIAGERRYRYRELRDLSERLADHLVALGMQPGDRIVVQLPNVAESVVLYFALAKIGALPIMALPAHRATEIDYFLRHAEACAYAIPSVHRNFDHIALARELKQAHARLRWVFVADRDAADEDGFVSLPRLLEREAPARPPHRPDPFDVALFLLSGGTTGIPKLIPRTHADYLYNSRQANEVCAFDESTVLLVAIPISHNFALACPGLQGVFLAGGTVVLAAAPDPDAILDAVARERVTCIPAVPALHIALMDRQAAAPRDLSSLRQIVAGGSKFLPENAARASRVLGCRVQQVLGMAEGLLSFTRLDDPEPVVLHTVGRPMSADDEFRLVDDDGRDVACGEIGELWVRGPYTIRGYYRAAEHNAKAFTVDGFYKTGDMLRLDPAGHLVVEGRLKDMINRAGEKISAEEVENLVADHPKVREAALVAMPDRVTGEKGCLFVTCREGQALTLLEIVAHLEKKRVARFKFPERLEVVERFPLTAVGKISKKELRDAIARKVASPSVAEHDFRAGADRDTVRPGPARGER
jgi:2,3-dihydroxybenzoate-AMP ligase